MISDTEVLAALPEEGWLRDYVLWAKDRIDSPIAFHLAAGLTALSQTVPAQVHVPYGIPVYANLYSLIVGDSAQGKGIAISLLQEIFKTGSVDVVATEPGSQQFLEESLLARPKQLLVLPEFGHFLAASRTGFMEPIKMCLAKVYDNIPLTRGTLKKGAPKRKGASSDENAKVVYPRLGILGGCTPKHLEDYTNPIDWNGGFLSRFLTFLPEKHEYRKHNTNDPEGMKALAERFVSLYAVSATPDAATYGNCLGFEESALECWDEFMASLRDVQKASIESEVAGAIARAQLFALKIALVLAWSDGTAFSGGDWYLTCKHIQQAHAIINLHLKSILAIGETLSTTKDMKDRRTVLTLISKNHREPTPISAITHKSKLLIKRVKEILGSLQCEKAIGIVYQDDEPFYFQLPFEQSAFIPQDENAVIESTETIAPVISINTRKSVETVNDVLAQIEDSSSSSSENNESTVFATVDPFDFT